MTTIPLRECWFSSAGKPALLFQEHAGFNHFATTFVVYKGFKRPYINKHEQFFFAKKMLWQPYSHTNANASKELNNRLLEVNEANYLFLYAAGLTSFAKYV